MSDVAARLRYVIESPLVNLDDRLRGLLEEAAAALTPSALPDPAAELARVREELRQAQNILLISERAGQIQRRDAIIVDLEARLRRAVYLAAHLLAMVPRVVWRDSGGDDGQGHYEGDYRADQVAAELADLRRTLPESAPVAASAVADTEPPPDLTAHRPKEPPECAEVEPLWSWNTTPEGVALNVVHPARLTVEVTARDLQRMTNHHHLSAATLRERASRRDAECAEEETSRPPAALVATDHPPPDETDLGGDRCRSRRSAGNPTVEGDTNERG